MELTTKGKNHPSRMVRVRGGFSEANGISVCDSVMQIDELDDITRVRISNCLYKVLDTFMEECSEFCRLAELRDDVGQTFCQKILDEVFCKINFLSDDCCLKWQLLYKDYIAKVISDAPYNEVFDVVEYIVRWIADMPIGGMDTYAYTALNNVFEQECVGYRFVDGRIVAITDEHEIAAIDEACSVPFEGCRKHFEKATGFLANRETKDYKNSIKESISAVESVCQVILNNSKAVLSDALKQLEKNGMIIHPALNQAFIKMYAYTSDQGGIRHAEGMFESTVTFEEAKFMMVSCCAFTNYLIAEYRKKSS